MNRLIEKIEDNSNIVIYGAGTIGEQLVNLICRSKRQNIVAVIDQNPINKMIGFDVSVISIEELKEICYDCLIIAIKNKNIVDEVRENLMQAGVPEEKIICYTSYEELDEGTFEYEKFLERNILIRKNRKAFLFMVPEHGNTGDYAIEKAELKFFNDYFPEFDVLTVTTGEWLASRSKIRNLVAPEDIIFINGGGYIGDLWPETPTYRSIVDEFPINKVFFFPNTLTYKAEKYVLTEAFNEEMRWFDKRQNVKVLFRERKSFDTFSRYCKNGSLYPDMVLSLHRKQRDKEKNGKVLLCFRNDRERACDVSRIVSEQLRLGNYDYDEFDLALSRYVLQESGIALVEFVCEKFQEYDLIMTDRLHGMLLSVISDVPCIAFDNVTKKISGVYEWIENKEYALLLNVEDAERINSFIPLAIERKRKAGEFKPLISEFNNMSKYFRSVI